MFSKGLLIESIRCQRSRWMGANKKNNKQKTRKHFSDGPCGTIVPGTNPHLSQGQTGQMAILLWNWTEKGRFVPGTGPNLSQGGVPFVPGTVPVCPGHRPAQNFVFIGFFSCPKEDWPDDVKGCRQGKMLKDVLKGRRYRVSLMRSRHPSPNVKTLWNFEPKFWPEMITSRDAESACLKGSRTLGRKRSHHVMDASCRLKYRRKGMSLVADTKRLRDIIWSKNRTGENRTGLPRPPTRGPFRGHLRGMFRGDSLKGWKQENQPSWVLSWGLSWGHSWAHSWVKFRFRLFCASSIITGRIIQKQNCLHWV